MSINEKQLILATVNGDTQAFSSLMTLHKDFVFSLVLRMTRNRPLAGEITQDCFVRVFRKLKDFKGDSTFRSWLYTIAYRLTLDKLKSEKRHRTEDLENSSAQFLFDQSGEGEIEKREVRSSLDSAIAHLSPKEASVITLFYFKELSIKEIREITGFELNNIKIILHRGRNKLKDLLIKNHSKTLEEWMG